MTKESDEEGVDIVSGLTDAVLRLASANPGRRIRAVFLEVSGEEGPVVSALQPHPATATRKLSPSFNVQGHALIGELAVEEVLSKANPNVYDAVHEIIDNAPADRRSAGALARWPDDLKSFSANDPLIKQIGGHRKEDHYVNYAYSRVVGVANKPENPIPPGRLIEALEEWCQKLAGETDPGARAIALGFVLHLAGDIHQPLHATMLIDEEMFPEGSHGDDGGNKIWWNTSDTLHGFWDNAVVRTSAEYVKRYGELAPQLTPDNRQEFTSELARKDFVDWASESYYLAIDAYERFFSATTAIGPSERKGMHGEKKTGYLFTSPGSEYYNDSRDVARRQARIAAFRIADLLAARLA